MTPTELSKAAGISVPYASQILSNDPEKARAPSRSLAIHILRATGFRHAVLDGLTDADLEVIERLDPYTPKEAA